MRSITSRRAGPRSFRHFGIGLAMLSLGVWGVLALWIGAGPAAARQAGTPTPSAVIEAIVAVERAPVFPSPDRNTQPITTLFQRERVPVRGQTPDGVFLLTTVDQVDGWILRAQVDLTGDLAQVPVVTGVQGTPTATFTPFVASLTPTITPFGASPTPSSRPTRTPLPTRTPAPASDSGTPTLVPTLAGTPAEGDLPAVVPGVPPPLTITLPEGWNTVHLEVPFKAFDGQVHSVPLSIYTGPLADGITGYVYLYWGFPNVVDLNGNYNLWADGVQLLRGSLIGETCNLGIDEQMAFRVGNQEGVGTYYAAVSCQDEKDTAGWFAALRVDAGSYAFFTAVEPFSVLADQIPALQAILDSVKFEPLDTP